MALAETSAAPVPPTGAADARSTDERLAELESKVDALLEIARAAFDKANELSTVAGTITAALSSPGGLAALMKAVMGGALSRGG